MVALEYFNNYIIILYIIKQATNQNNVPSSIIIKLIFFFSKSIVKLCNCMLFDPVNFKCIIRITDKIKAVFFS